MEPWHSHLSTGCSINLLLPVKHQLSASAEREVPGVDWQPLSCWQSWVSVLSSEGGLPSLTLWLLPFSLSHFLIMRPPGSPSYFFFPYSFFHLRKGKRNPPLFFSLLGLLEWEALVENGLDSEVAEASAAVAGVGGWGWGRPYLATSNEHQTIHTLLSLWGLIFHPPPSSAPSVFLISLSQRAEETGKVGPLSPGSNPGVCTTQGSLIIPVLGGCPFSRMYVRFWPLGTAELGVDLIIFSWSKFTGNCSEGR